MQVEKARSSKPSNLCLTCAGNKKPEQILPKMSPKLIKSGLLEMHLLLFLVSCGDILVHGRWPPCAVLWSHVCGLECSELSGETGHGDATQRAELDPKRHEGPISNRALFFRAVHLACDQIIASSTPNIVYYASNWETLPDSGTCGHRCPMWCLESPVC